MSDTEMPAAAATDAGEEKSGTSAAFEGMPQADVDFIMACIKNAMEGVLTVDAQKIAEDLGYKNLRSVGNRVGSIRKKYGLAISVSSTKGSASASKSAATPKTPRTPKGPKVAADKVTKASASRGKKSATKKNETTPEPESAEAEEDEDSEMADAEPVKAPVSTKKAAASKKETPAKKQTAKKATPAKKETPAKKTTTTKKVATPKKSADKVESSDSEDMMVDADEELEDLAVKGDGDATAVEQEVAVEDADEL